MDIADAIREMLWQKRMTQRELTERCGGIRSLVSSRLTRKNNISLENVLQMVHACGYELTVQPIKAGRRPENQIVITRMEEEEE